MRRFASITAVLCLPLCACEGADGAVSSVTREVVGDTTILRVSGDGVWGAAARAEETLRIGELDGAEAYTFGDISGLAVRDDGNVYVLDDHSHNVRVFDPAGAHVRTFGRSGSGPGEISQAIGMQFLPDGRLAVRDFNNARINLYSAEGEPVGNYRIPSGLVTSAPMYVDDAGNLYTQVVVDRGGPGVRTGLVRIDSTGVMRDTLRAPASPAEAAMVTAERVSSSGTSRSAAGVPFMPSMHWTLARDGGVVSGFSDRYAVSIRSPDGGVLRLERAVEPVAVQQAERDAAVEGITRNMQNLDGNWRWNGPQPPTTKPAFRGLFADEDGRIWVLRSQEGRPVPADPDAKPDARGRMPVQRWTEDMAYDVWDRDGTLLGTVVMPDRFELMAARGTDVWGVIRDEFDVQYVVRLQVRPEA